ncbi:MAG TPA: cupin-like domain-containing protein [Chitinophagaceae bacterium]|nr:cupin-like domain-containing protein [Chitinophagaceae bacterium]
MLLEKVDTVAAISPEDFKSKYYTPQIPVVMTDLARQWPAYHKWTWDYFKQIVGDKKVALYNNIKSDAYTPINTADDYKTFGEYIDMIQKGPAGWRIFLFNIFDHAPQLLNDFTWPEELMKGFVKKYPMLFTGGQTSITHMHFDIDMSHILHTQFIGRKRVLLFPFQEQHKLYRKPFEVLSLADFSNYNQDSGNPDYEKFPALKHAKGYEIILQHGDTLFMPAGYWHHMEYLDSGFAMSLRALQSSLSGKAKGVWNLFGMRTIDTIMKRTMPKSWYNYKVRKIDQLAKEEIEKAGT